MISAVPTFSILLVDDNDLQLKLVVRSLKKVFEKSHFSYSITEAMDGKSAWKICQGKKFDLYIVDYCMPEMNGIELCYLILEKQAAKIVLYTSEEPDRVLQMKGNMDPAVDVLPKDVSQLKLYITQYIQIPSIAKQFTIKEELQ